MNLDVLRSCLEDLAADVRVRPRVVRVDIIEKEDQLWRDIYGLVIKHDGAEFELIHRSSGAEITDNEWQRFETEVRRFCDQRMKPIPTKE